MGLLRSWLRKLERDSRDDLASFELREPEPDGSRYYYSQQGQVELYVFCYDCIGKHPDDWQPPEVLQKLCEAKNPRAAFEAVLDGSPNSDFLYSDVFPYRPEAIIHERRLVPRSLVAGRSAYEWEIDDLSE